MVDYRDQGGRKAGRIQGKGAEKVAEKLVIYYLAVI
jgi:hypothetical protein